MQCITKNVFSWTAVLETYGGPKTFLPLQQGHHRGQLQYRDWTLWQHKALGRLRRLWATRARGLGQSPVAKLFLVIAVGDSLEDNALYQQTIRGMYFVLDFGITLFCLWKDHCTFSLSLSLFYFIVSSVKNILMERKGALAHRFLSQKKKKSNGVQRISLHTYINQSK